MIENSFALYRAIGAVVGMAPIRRLAELGESLEALTIEGAIDHSVYQDYLADFDREPPPNFPARSMILVAVPQPQVQLQFVWRGTPRLTRVPPTYLFADRTDREVAGRLRDEGHCLAPARIPKKLLAARIGLARYGRNNITYVDGMGSFQRLVAFYSDQPSERDRWDELKLLDRCAGCEICHYECPTGAIKKDRFFVQSERCLVYHNEKIDEELFPIWIEPDWHHCLVGCMRCQERCPENEGVIDWVEQGPSFTEWETAMIAVGTPLDRLDPDTREKLVESDLSSFMNFLPRNLKGLIDTWK